MSQPEDISLKIAQVIFQLTFFIFAEVFLSLFNPIIDLPTLGSLYGILFEGLVLTAYVFIGLMILSKPVNLVGYVTSRLDKKHLFWKFSVYGLLSTIVFVIPFVFLLAYLPNLILTGQDPLLGRYYSGHWIVWFGLVLVGLEFGWKNVIKGLFAGAFVYCSHEGVWAVQSVAQFSRFQYTGLPYQQSFLSVGWVMLTDFSPLITTIILGLIGYFVVCRVFSLKKEIAIVAIPAIWGIIDLIFNFPNTIILGTFTPSYSDPVINAAEVLTWVIPIVIAMVPSDIVARMRRFNWSSLIPTFDPLD